MAGVDDAGCGTAEGRHTMVVGGITVRGGVDLAGSFKSSLTAVAFEVPAIVPTPAPSTVLETSGVRVTTDTHRFSCTLLK